MSEDTSHGRSHSRWVGWTLALLAVPVVYLLTWMPLVLYLSLKHHHTSLDDFPPLQRAYFASGNWIYEETPAHDPMEAYGEWWYRKFVPLKVP